MTITQEEREAKLFELAEKALLQDQARENVNEFLTGPDGLPEKDIALRKSVYNDFLKDKIEKDPILASDPDALLKAYDIGLGLALMKQEAEKEGSGNVSTPGTKQNYSPQQQQSGAGAQRTTHAPAQSSGVTAEDLLAREDLDEATKARLKSAFALVGFDV